MQPAQNTQSILNPSNGPTSLTAEWMEAIHQNKTETRHDGWVTRVSCKHIIDRNQFGHGSKIVCTYFDPPFVTVFRCFEKNLSNAVAFRCFTVPPWCIIAPLRYYHLLMSLVAPLMGTVGWKKNGCVYVCGVWVCVWETNMELLTSGFRFRFVARNTVYAILFLFMGRRSHWWVCLVYACLHFEMFYFYWESTLSFDMIRSKKVKQNLHSYAHAWKILNITIYVLNISLTTDILIYFWKVFVILNVNSVVVSF